jgi:pimeloyl-ACP methyl ester carboxylesterase
MDRHVLFVAPDSVDRSFRRIAEPISGVGRQMFHPLALLSPDLDPDAWSIEMEVEGLAAITRSTPPSDLVGYSGGAAIGLAFAASYPQRIRSLCLIEPPWIGNDIWSESERAFVQGFDRLVSLDSLACNLAFLELFAPGANLPPFDAPDVFAKALRLVWRGYRETSLDRASLSRVNLPALLPVAAGSTRRMAEQAGFLVETVFPKGSILNVEGSNHFDILKAGARAIANALIEFLRSTER